MSFCRSIKTEYDALKKLNSEFVSACAKGKQDGNFQHLSPQELQTLQLLKQALEKARDSLKEKFFVSPEAAEKIMNKNFFGPEAIEAAFNITLSPKDIPPIRWTTQELKEAKHRGEFLILRISHTPDGARLTMRKIAELVQPTLTANRKGEALVNFNWDENESFYTQEPCRLGWALVYRDILPDSIEKDYIQQTRLLIDHLKNKVFNNKPLSPEYQTAVDQFETYLHDTFPNKTDEEINKNLGGPDCKRYAEALANQPITILTRHIASEAFYDAMLLRATTKYYSLLFDVYTWTSSCSSDGLLVNVGNADANGANVGGWNPDHRGMGIGVLFSRLR